MSAILIALFALYGLGSAVRAVWRRLAWAERRAVSVALRRDWARAEMRAGWDGPRWDLARGRKAFDEGWRQ